MDKGNISLPDFTGIEELNLIIDIVPQKCNACILGNHLLGQVLLVRHVDGLLNKTILITMT